jgi:glycosyltransferase involved in cell wall biosynthesis
VSGDREPFRVALYSGVFFAADAVSTSLRYKLDFLNHLASTGVPVKTTVFTHASDSDDRSVQRITAMHELLGDAAFQDADLHVFEYGIWYELFNTIFLTPPDQVRVGVYHNVTPPALVDTPEQENVLKRSLRQVHNLGVADHVVCDSEFNRDDLVDLGFPAEGLSVLHLPAAIDPLPRTGDTGGEVRLLFVGRLVRAKGVFDLLDALSRVLRGGAVPVRLTLAGNIAFSSPAALGEIEARLRTDPLRAAVTLVPSPGDRELAALYAAADVLVIPSYHEGYCLPVVEALAAGCQVIAYDAGNLPFIVDSLGTIVRAGDVAALATAIADVAHATTQRDGTIVIDGAQVPRAAWRATVQEHLARYSPAAYRAGLVELLRWAMARRGRGDMAQRLS